MPRQEENKNHKNATGTSKQQMERPWVGSIAGREHGRQGTQLAECGKGVEVSAQPEREKG